MLRQESSRMLSGSGIRAETIDVLKDVKEARAKLPPKGTLHCVES